MNSPLKRQLGFWETVRQNTHLNQFGTSQIGIIAKIKGPLAVQTVQQSLNLLFQQQPLLQARIEKISNDYWFILDRNFDDIPFKILERSSPNLWQTITEQELAHPSPTHQYLWKAIFIHGREGKTDEHELLLIFHHGIADGLSAAHAIKNILYCCQQLAEGKQPVLQKMPFMDCVEKNLQKKISWNEYVKQLQNHHELPQEENWHYLTQQPVGQRVTKGLFRDFSYEFLLEQCRQQKVTINSAIAAALIYSGYANKIHSGPISMLTLIDLRKYCEPPWIRDYLSCSVTCVLTKHLLSKLNKSSFWNLAREYQEALYKKISQLAFTPYEFNPQTIENFSIANPLGTINKNNSRESYSVDFCLTNLGRIDIPQDYGLFHLKNFYFCTSRQAGAIGCIANVVAFPDRMYICLGYAEPLLSENAIKNLSDVFFKILDLDK